MKGQWVALPREVIESDAWRSASIHVRKFVDFLMNEHLRRGGKWNGRLLAPRTQLQAYGIGAKYIAAAIKDATLRLNLVDVEKRGERIASHYGLSFLERHDGPASDRWREFRNTALIPLDDIWARKSPNLSVKRPVGLVAKRNSDGRNLSVKRDADTGNLPPNSLVAKSNPLSRKEAMKGGAPLRSSGKAAGSKDDAPASPAPPLSRWVV